MENSNLPEDANVIKSLEHLKLVLIGGETLEEWAIQRRLFALLNRRVLIAATSGRFIVIKRGLFGGFTMTDLRWQDLGDIKLNVGIFGAGLSIKIFGSTDLAINKYSSSLISLSGFRKDQTQNIYRLAQAHDQSWREKRRIRELEELRAKSGGFNIGGAQPNVQQTTPTQEDSIERLKKAKEMLENKLINDSEYETIKARIISGL
ncbi:MAG: PH domain-containing protein [Bacteroidales bacterium]